MSLEDWLLEKDDETQTELLTAGVPKLVAMRHSLYEPYQQLFATRLDRQYMKELTEKVFANILAWRDISLNNIIETIFYTTLEQIAKGNNNSTKTTKEKNHQQADNKAEQMAILAKETILGPQLAKITELEKKHYEELFPQEEDKTTTRKPHYMTIVKYYAQEFQKIIANSCNNTPYSKEEIREQSECWGTIDNNIIQVAKKQKIIVDIYNNSKELLSRGVAYIQTRQKTAKSIAEKFADKLTDIDSNTSDELIKVTNPRTKQKWVEDPFNEPMQDFAGAMIATQDFIVPGERFTGVMEAFFNKVNGIRGLEVELIKNEFRKEIKDDFGNIIGYKPTTGNDTRLVKLVVSPTFDYLKQIQGQLPYPEVSPLNVMLNRTEAKMGSTQGLEEERKEILKRVFDYSLQIMPFYDSFLYHVGPRAHHIYVHMKEKKRNNLSKEEKNRWNENYEKTSELLPEGRINYKKNKL